MVENIPNLMKGVNVHIQEAQETQGRLMQRDPHPNTKLENIK